MSPDAAERLVAGRWTLHTPLRRGPAGVIWRATEVAGGRPLAVEELRLPALPDPAEPGQSTIWHRVATEARAAAALDHPGLVRLDDVVVEDGVVYVAGELVEALTLDELIARHGPLPVRRVARLGFELLGPLEAVHAAGLAHLDLHPGCVLITPAGPTRLAGAGLAPLRSLAGAERATAAFLAPEQVRGDPLGAPADLWSLGAILYLAVEGETPFPAGGTDATLTAILRDRPRPPEHAGPLAPTLTALLTKPANGRPGPALTRHLLDPLTGSAGLPAGVVSTSAAAAPSAIAPLAAVPFAPAPFSAAPSGAVPSAAAPVAVTPFGLPPVDPAASHGPDPGAPHPPDPVPGPPEGEHSPWDGWGPETIHSLPDRLRASPDRLRASPDRLRASRNRLRSYANRLRRIPSQLQWPWAAGGPVDPVVRRVLLIAGGSVLLALVSFTVAVAVSGDPLGLGSQAVASTVPPTTLPPSTTAVPTTITPTTQAPVVPPGWAVHTDPATGYQVAVPPGWQVVSDGGPRTELRDQSSPTLLRIDWLLDPQADPVSVEQQASQAHAGELDGYSPARLEPAQFKGLPAALLEFTYQDGETWHALELGVRTPRHHVAMAIHTRDRDWGAGWALFEAFKASFVPPPT